MFNKRRAGVEGAEGFLREAAIVRCVVASLTIAHKNRFGNLGVFPTNKFLIFFAQEMSFLNCVIDSARNLV